MRKTKNLIPLKAFIDRRCEGNNLTTSQLSINIKNTPNQAWKSPTTLYLSVAATGETLGKFPFYAESDYKTLVEYYYDILHPDIAGIIAVYILLGEKGELVFN